MTNGLKACVTVLALQLAVFGIAQSIAAEGTTSMFDPEREHLVLSPRQLHESIDQALSGDAEAAHRLVLHYMQGVGDMNEGLRWVQIGAENGDPGIVSNVQSIDPSLIPH